MFSKLQAQFLCMLHNEPTNDRSSEWTDAIIVNCMLGWSEWHQIYPSESCWLSCCYNNFRLLNLKYVYKRYKSIWFQCARNNLLLLLFFSPHFRLTVYIKITLPRDGNAKDHFSRVSAPNGISALAHTHTNRHTPINR